MAIENNNRSNININICQNGYTISTDSHYRDVGYSLENIYIAKTKKDIYDILEKIVEMPKSKEEKKK